MVSVEASTDSNSVDNFEDISVPERSVRAAAAKWFFRLLVSNNIEGMFAGGKDKTSASHSAHVSSLANLTEEQVLDFFSAPRLRYWGPSRIAFEDNDIVTLYNLTQAGDCFKEAHLRRKAVDDASFAGLYPAFLFNSCQALFDLKGISRADAEELELLEFRSEQEEIISKMFREFLPEVKDFLKASYPEGFFSSDYAGQKPAGRFADTNKIVFIAIFRPELAISGSVVSFESCLRDHYLESLVLGSSREANIYAFDVETLLGLPCATSEEFTTTVLKPDDVDLKAFVAEVFKLSDLHFANLVAEINPRGVYSPRSGPGLRTSIKAINLAVESVKALKR